MANFSFEPNYVTPRKTHLTHLTPSEAAGKKESLKIDDDPDVVYDLLFKGQSQAEYEDLLEHYDGQSGSHLPFTWDNVPPEINSGNPLYVRYAEQNPFVETPIPAGMWEVRIRFEKVSE